MKQPGGSPLCLSGGTTPADAVGACSVYGPVVLSSALMSYTPPNSILPVANERRQKPTLLLRFIHKKTAEEINCGGKRPYRCFITGMELGVSITSITQ
ncbi:hypothetical protein AOLI_G00070650 [Acnodon oligacanthus]